MTDPTYLDTLLLYYEEEVEGEAFFAELATRFDDPQHRQKLMLLADVERHAARAVAPLIAKYGLTPRPLPDLVRCGQKDARNTPAEWRALLSEMRQTYPEYLDDFRALEAMGPAEDFQRLSFLSEHEVAAIAFLELEAENPDQSADPLRAYLATAPEAWGRAAE